MKSTGPTESPVGLCHKKNASTFRPLPDCRPAIYLSIQNEYNAVSRNVNRSFTGCLFRAASFPRTTFWTCSLPRSSTCAFGTCDSPFFPQVSTKREGETARGELFFPPTVCRLPSLGGRSVASFLSFIRSNEWRRPGSNRQPPACKAGALPVELRPPGRRVVDGPNCPWLFSPGRQQYRMRDRGEARCRDTEPPRPAPVGTRGFEPRTSALSELRSNQLSYAPVLTGMCILSHRWVAVQPSIPGGRGPRTVATGSGSVPRNGLF